MPKAKLPLDKHGQLVEAFDIDFQGPIPAARWPSQYARIFQKIRQIGRMQYDKYLPSDRRGILKVIELKDRVAKLNETAYNCRRQGENEDTWRGQAEPEVVSRFEAVCRTCGRRTWESEFQANPDPATEERLRECRHIRTLCTCTPEDKATKNSRERRPEPVFVNRISPLFVLDPIDNLNSSGLHDQKPDRVFGLSVSSAFKQYCSARQSLRHSPFSKNDILYPFLIIEAKSEKNSPGFRAIEIQTAFPIRTLLKLQLDLRDSSQSHLKPLVWFLTYVGDEWRLYACVPDGLKTQVIDLWHGTILSEDGALQLFLIMDFICDWARVVYRIDILHCLANEDLNMREVTPAYTSASSQMGESNYSQSSLNHSTPRAPSPVGPSLIDLTENYDEEDGLLQYEQLGRPEQPEQPMEEINENLDAADLNDDRFLERSSITLTILDHQSGSQPTEVALRHSNLVLFSFHHIAIPEDVKTLRTYVKLVGLSGSLSSSETARMLLANFSGEDAVFITMEGVIRLEWLWTRANEHPPPSNGDPIRGQIIFRSYFLSEGWQVVRELTCMTATKKAMAELMHIAGSSGLGSSLNLPVHQCPCLTETTQALRSLSGKESATIAARLLILQLRKGEMSSHFYWDNISKTTSNESGLAIWNIHLQPKFRTVFHHHIHHSTLLQDLLPGPVVPFALARLLEPSSKLGAESAILLQKPDSWPALTPLFCLMAYNEQILDDEPSLLQTLRCLQGESNICQAQDTACTREAVT